MEGKNKSVNTIQVCVFAYLFVKQRTRPKTQMMKIKQDGFPEIGKNEASLGDECGEMKGQNHCKCQTKKEYFQRRYLDRQTQKRRL